MKVPRFEKNLQVRVKAARPWNGLAQTLKYSKESGWWYEVLNDRTGLTWSCHSSNVKPLKGARYDDDKKDAVPVRRRRQGSAGTHLDAALG